MPKAISDTSPIQYLHQTGNLELLSSLYETILVPGAVLREIDQGRALYYNLPELRRLEWVELRSSPHEPPPLFPAALGAGEREVIQLAVATPDSLAILDDELARRFARGLGLRVTGTLGVLLKTKQAGALPAIAPILAQLDALGFRVSATTRTAVLKLAAEDHLS